MKRRKARLKTGLRKHRRRFHVERLEPRQLLVAGLNMAIYEFTNNTTTTPEFFSTDVHVETMASDIESPLSLGWTGNGQPPNGLALGGAFNETTEPTPAGGQSDYFEVTVTPLGGYEMTTSRFSMQIRRNDPDSKNSYSVYFDEDPGGGGNNFATKLASGTITSEDVFESIIVDVEGMPEFTNQTTSLTFRVYAWGTAGLGTMRLDNIRVQAIQESVSESSLAYYGDAGRLLHPLDPLGNRIADFSTAGYRNGNQPIPDVTLSIAPARIVNVTPTAGDDMAAIQAAIDQVGALTFDTNGFRGIVQLSAGEFEISDQVVILDSGVVLRGVGDGDNPATSTILRGTGTLKRSIVVVGASAGFASGIANTTHNIVDKYVPVGATSLLVDSTTNWSVGDPVVVRRPSTADWIADIGMDMIPPRSDGGTVVQWEPGGNFDHLYERVITRIEGDRVFFNAPLMNSFEQKYGGGTVWRYTFPRINNVGIENIRGTSDFVSPTDEDHASTFIELQAVEDAWVTNVTGQHFLFATVHATSRAIRVTVDDAVSLEPISIVTGGRRYPFTIDGQFVLMQNLYSEDGRHDFANNSSWRNRGPNVFLNGTAVNSNSSTGPHQRWSSGTLYDTISTDNLTEARNRGNFGSGHGWGGANMVFWNNTATQFIVQNPPTAQNWLIGSTGQLVDETRFGSQPPGTVSEHETPIDFGDPTNPLSSLYVAQHNQRTANPATQKREYVLGDFDLIDFDGVGSADEVFVDPDWAVSVGAVGTAVPFDDTTDDRVVPFSFAFQDAPGEIVIAATLSLGLRGTGGNTLDDAFRFESVSDIRTFASLGMTSPLSLVDTTPILIELTGADLVALQDGLLNLAIDNHTTVDWAVLDLTVENLTQYISIADAAIIEGHAGTTNLTFDVTLNEPHPSQVSVDVTVSDGSATSIGVERVATGLTEPVFATSAPGQPDLLYVVEQGGVIKVLDLTTNTVNATPFLNVSGLTSGGERGLLGLAFDPHFDVNSLFYIYMTDANQDTLIRQYQANTDALTADPTTARPIMGFDQPHGNHNGGWIGFGPDGYLYVASGDGGAGNDPDQNGQDITNNLLGKMLRIDVGGVDFFPTDPVQNYAIPPDNPFVGAGNGESTEIWAYGLRNPWRSSFDRLTGDLYIGDVGQSAREEINVQPASSLGGINYGWRAQEGTISNPVLPDAEPAGAIDPIYDYSHGTGPDQGFSVTGGYVYRGPIKELQGQYFFADYFGKIWSLRYNGDAPADHDGTNHTDFTLWTDKLIPDAGVINRISSFAEDAAGNLYILDHQAGTNGEIFRISKGADFLAKTETLIFNTGTTSQTFDVEVVGDRHPEASESLIVTLSNAVNTTIGDGVGIGTILNDDAPRIVDVVVNRGETQRSIVDEVVVTFDSLATFDESSGSAFKIVNRGNAAVVNHEKIVTAGNGQTIVTFSFLAGPSVELRDQQPASLADGNYEIIALELRVGIGGVPLDGNGDGIGGDDFTYGDEAVDEVFRFYGDSDGDRFIGIGDLFNFGDTYLLGVADPNYDERFDFDGNDFVGIGELFEFGDRYLQPLTF